jgi:hypothetical protein
MELVTRLPGGVLYVFLLTAGIAALAFSGRRIEARREARRYRVASAPAAS